MNGRWGKDEISPPPSLRITQAAAANSLELSALYIIRATFVGLLPSLSLSLFIYMYIYTARAPLENSNKIYQTPTVG